VHRGSLGDSELRTRLGGHSELAPALLKAVWWDLRLASLLAHLFIYLFTQKICTNKQQTSNKILSRTAKL